MGVSIADMSDPAYGVGCRSNSPASDPPIVCESDLAISTTFFSTFPQSVYLVELNATNSQEASGGNLAQLSARANVLQYLLSALTSARARDRLDYFYHLNLAKNVVYLFSFQGTTMLNVNQLTFVT